MDKPNEYMPDGEYGERDLREARDLALEQMALEVKARQQVLALLAHVQTMLGEAIALLSALEDPANPEHERVRAFLAAVARL